MYKAGQIAGQTEFQFGYTVRSTVLLYDYEYNWSHTTVASLPPECP